jgi:glycosyltransferase involved in cell wall biosynthesis
MNIVFVNTLAVWGGCERWVVQVGAALAQRGHQITIMSLPGSETEQNAKKAGLNTKALSLGVDVAFWKIPGLMKFFRRNKSDVVVCVQNRDVKVAGLAAKLAEVPVVLARNGLDVIKKKPDHRLAFTKFVDGIMTNAKVLKDTYMSYGWFADEFIHVIYDGLKLPENVEEIDLRKEAGFPRECKLIVTAGRLVSQKGFDYLVEVASLAKKHKKKWRFVVVGTGKLEGELQNLVRKLQVDEYIKFVGFRSNILAYLNAADLFVLSSRSEGLSSVLREAMSLGKASVATAVNGVPELFQDGRAGLMVERHNPQAMHDGIEKVLKDPDLKAKYEKEALARIKEDFLEEVMIDRLEVLFHTYLDKRKLSQSQSAPSAK